MDDSKSHRKALLQIAKSVTNDDELANHLKFRAIHGTEPRGPDLNHVPLESTRHIRLLSLLPGNLHDEICCELKQVQIDSPDTVYTAISYTWGDPELRIPIRCNNALIRVTVNLYSALLRLRRSDVKFVLWIDAVCIDQSPGSPALAERAEQIRIMGTIFSSAKKVIVDLGGIQAGELKQLLEISDVWNRDLDDMTTWNEWVDKHGAKDSFSTMTHQHLELVDNMAWRPWFGRVWVIQEFVLAKEVELMVGTVMIGTGLLNAILEILIKCIQGRLDKDSNISLLRSSSKHYDMSRWLKTSHLISYMTRERRVRSSSGEAPVAISILDTVALCQSTRKQDRIYGVLGLLDLKDSSAITVDYSQSDSTLESTFTTALIDNGFLAACLTRATGFNNDRPSWAPLILNAQQDGFEMITKTILAHFQLYTACGVEAATSASVAGTSGVLATPALQVDFLRSMSLPNKYDLSETSRMMMPGRRNRQRELLTELISWYQYAMHWMDENFSDQESHDRRRVFWRTLTWDRMADQQVLRRYGQDSREVDSELESMTRDGLAFMMSPRTEPLRFLSASISAGKLCFTAKMRLCRTLEGRVALVPEESVHGNEIWILQGVSIPVVLRRVDRGQHVFVGFCYVHGIMDGQAWDLHSAKVENVYIR